MAIAYAFWLRDACPGLSIFWVHGSSPYLLQESLRTLARDCEIEGYGTSKDLIMLVRTWLARKINGPWLIIVDNADDESMFTGKLEGSTQRVCENDSSSARELVSDCPHGSVLFTTRSKRLGNSLMRDGPIEVGRMRKEESCQLLRSMVKDPVPSDHDATVLSSRLEWLPLAIAQAAAFITTNGITLQEYVSLLTESDESMLTLLSEHCEAEGQHWEDQRAVAQTWMVSFQQIEKTDKIAAELLSITAALDRHEIPEKVLWTYLTMPGGNRTSAPSRVAFTKAVGVLTGYCLMTRGKTGTLDVHRLIHLVTWGWLVQKGSASAYHLGAIRSLTSLCWERGLIQLGIEGRAYVPHCFTLIRRHVEDPPNSQVVAQGKGILGAGLCDLLNQDGRLEEASELGARSVLHMKSGFGKSHPFTLLAMLCHANTFVHKENWTEAEIKYKELLKLSRRECGEDSMETLTIKRGLAMTYAMSGKLIEGENLILETVKLSKSVLGEGHHIIFLMELLAHIWGEQGRHTESRALFSQAIHLRQIEGGSSHRDMSISSFLILMGKIQEGGELDEALPMAEGQVQAFRKRRGPGHPITLTAMRTLGSMYRVTGRLDEAERLARVVARGRLDLYGAEHPETMRAFADVALCCWKLGRDAEAGQLMLACIERGWIFLGPKHPEIMGWVRGWMDIRGLLQENTPESRRQRGVLLFQALNSPHDDIEDYARRWLAEAAFVGNGHAVEEDHERAFYRGGPHSELSPGNQQGLVGPVCSCLHDAQLDNVTDTEVAEQGVFTARACLQLASALLKRVVMWGILITLALGLASRETEDTLWI